MCDRSRMHFAVAVAYLAGLHCMATARQSKTWSDSLLALLGVLNLLLLGMIGVVSPLSRDMFRGMGYESDWRCTVLAPIHWAWTVPLGFVVLIGLMRCSRLPTTTRRARTFIGLSVLLVALCVIVLLSVFTFSSQGEVVR